MTKREMEMSKEAPMYIYATEGVSSYYSILKINNKKILTVCGSGDQVLNAYFFGAKEVVGFDLNKRSEFITRIKIAAVKELSYEEFLKFFGENYTGASFDYSLYKKIRRNLDKKTIVFFDSLYKKHNFKGKKSVKSEYFRQREDVRLDIKKINLYLRNEKNYLKLRHILKNIKFKFVGSYLWGINEYKVKGIHFEILRCICLDNKCNVCHSSNFIHVDQNYNLRPCNLRNYRIKVDPENAEESIKKAVTFLKKQKMVPAYYKKIWT